MLVSFHLDDLSISPLETVRTWYLQEDSIQNTWQDLSFWYQLSRAVVKDGEICCSARRISKMTTVVGNGHAKQVG